MPCVENIDVWSPFEMNLGRPSKFPLTNYAINIVPQLAGAEEAE